MISRIWKRVPGLGEALPSRAVAVMWWLLLLAGLALAVYLAAAEKPWSAELQELAEGSSSKRVEYYAQVGTWWAALGNVGVAVLLLVSVGWWGRVVKAGPTIQACRRVYSPAARRCLIGGLAVAVMVGAYYRAPRLSLSFWNDEEYAFRRYVWGYYQPDEETGQLEFKQVRWRDSFFKNEEGNNHLWHTLEARAGLEVWQALSGAGGERFSEAAVRFAPFLGGLGSILLVGVLGAMCGRPLAGVMGAWFLALSPWHLRYAVEARGYSSMIFFILAGLIFLVKALEQGRWRWWLAYGGAQGVFLLCFTGAIYVAVVQNVCALLFILMNERWRGERAAVAGRWLVANALGAMVYLQLMAPSLMQLAAFMKDYEAETGDAVLGFAFLRDVWAHLSAGIPWSNAMPEAHLGTSMTAEMARHALFTMVVNVALPVAAVSGLVMMVCQRGEGWRPRLVALVFAGAAFFLWLHNAMAETKIMGWYFVFLAPGFALFVGWGAAVPWLKSFWWRGGVALGLAALFWGVTEGARAGLRDYPRQPIREVVEKVRRISPAFTETDEGVLTAAIGSGDRQMRSYDPWIRPVETRAELEGVIGEAREAGKKLAVYCCSPWRVEKEAPGAMALLRDESVFRSDGEWMGLEEFWSYEIFSLKRMAR